jgi:hypothetical protein
MKIEQLKSLQDRVVPVFFGETMVDKSRALVFLSDVGREQLLAVSYTKHR